MLLRSPLRVGALQEPGSVLLRSTPRLVLLRSTPRSELLRSKGRCSSRVGVRGGSCQERPSSTTCLLSFGIYLHESRSLGSFDG